VGLSDKADWKASALPYGDQRRLEIARAMVAEPRLLLLDEPATGLDLAAREQLLAGLDALRDQHPHLASVLVTHHIEEIPASTTHAVLLRDGEVVAQGTAADVISSEYVSKTFDHPVQITHDGGRWQARAMPGSPYVRPA
jgi:iron complex transport system ATP-binding protein